MGLSRKVRRIFRYRSFLRFAFFFLILWGFGFFLYKDELKTPGAPNSNKGSKTFSPVNELERQGTYNEKSSSISSLFVSEGYLMRSQENFDESFNTRSQGNTEVAMEEEEDITENEADERFERYEENVLFLERGSRESEQKSFEYEKDKVNGKVDEQVADISEDQEVEHLKESHEGEFGKPEKESAQDVKQKIQTNEPEEKKAEVLAYDKQNKDGRDIKGYSGAVEKWNARVKGQEQPLDHEAKKNKRTTKHKRKTSAEVEEEESEEGRKNSQTGAVKQPGGLTTIEGHNKRFQDKVNEIPSKNELQVKGDTGNFKIKMEEERANGDRALKVTLQSRRESDLESNKKPAIKSTEQSLQETDKNMSIRQVDFQKQKMSTESKDGTGAQDLTKHNWYRKNRFEQEQRGSENRGGRRTKDNDNIHETDNGTRNGNWSDKARNGAEIVDKLKSQENKNRKIVQPEVKIKDVQTPRREQLKYKAEESDEKHTPLVAEQASKTTWAQDLLQRRQEERRHLLNAYCQNHPDEKYLPSRNDMKHLVVLDEAKIIYCSIPKVASTEWKEALTVYNFRERIRGKRAQNRTLWKHLSDYSYRNITEKIQNYYKFLFVREPFARLLSAYRSKFEAKNEFYHKTFGREIIKEFRENANERSKNSGDDVTFLEFIKHIVFTYNHDEHWRAYDQLCHVCSMGYNFVGHLETIEEDALLLLEQARVGSRVTFQSRRRSRTSDVLLNYYSQIPMPFINRLHYIYSKDFEMFGYPFPGPLKPLGVNIEDY